MELTIDKKVSEVIAKEKKNLSNDQQSILKLVNDIELLTGNSSNQYTIAPKDTIGKNVRYNIRRQ